MAYDVVPIPASRATYTAGRGGADVLWLVIHYTGADGSARDNGRYFAGGNRNASAQYFVDDVDIVLSVSEEDTAWAVGNFAANQRSISIEVCSAGEDFSEAEIERLAWLVGDLMARYGIPAEHVVRHRDMYRVATAAGIGGGWVDPGKACPAPYVDDDKWAALHARITGGDIVTDQDIQRIAGAVWTYNWVNPQGEGTAPGGNMYNTATNTNVVVNAMKAAMDKLAEMAGADPDAIAKAVSDAVEKKLEGISLSVEVG